MANPIPLSITLEEHYSSRAFESSDAGKHDPINRMMPQLTEKLVDLDNLRIKNMDENRVALQIVSHTPSAASPAQVIRASNDELAAAVRANPTRLAGFANLRMVEPDEASRELERCVKELGFVGALVDNQAESIFYDGPEYHQFWAKAEELDTPIYLHPAWPSDKMVDAMYSGGGLEGNPIQAMGIGAFVFGWHASTATTVLRLLASKIFDKYPKLKIIIGHFGELLPYMFDRINKASARVFGVQRTFAEVMHSNVWITTSGMFDTNPLKCLLGVMPLERVMYSVDYPFSDNKLGKEFLEAIREEKILNEEQLKAFAHGNAAKLLFKDKTEKELGVIE